VSCPCHPPWLDYSNYIWRRLQLNEAPHYAVLSNIYHFAPFRSTKYLRLRHSLNVRHQVSHPYKTTGKRIVLYILMIQEKMEWSREPWSLREHVWRHTLVYVHEEEEEEVYFNFCFSVSWEDQVQKRMVTSCIRIQSAVIFSWILFCRTLHSECLRSACERNIGDRVFQSYYPIGRGSSLCAVHTIPFFVIKVKLCRTIGTFRQCRTSLHRDQKVTEHMGTNISNLEISLNVHKFSF
jgi:hypothetical protein